MVLLVVFGFISTSQSGMGASVAAPDPIEFSEKEELEGLAVAEEGAVVRELFAGNAAVVRGTPLRSLLQAPSIETTKIPLAILASVRLNAVRIDSCTATFRTLLVNLEYATL